MKPFLLTSLLVAMLYSGSAAAQPTAQEVHAAMVTAGLSERVYEPGIIHVGFPIVVSGDPTRVIHVYDTREHLDPNSLVSLSLERSTDGGLTWQGFAGITRPGGPNLNREG